MATQTKSEAALPELAIELEPLRWIEAEIHIVGETPLIPHRWSAKARAMMLSKQQGKAARKLPPKEAEREAYDATYWLGDQPAMPAVAFKAAIADAARYFERRVSIELLKRVVRVQGEGPDQLVPIVGDVSIREDTPRNASGTADLRYRNQIWPWSTTLKIRALADALTPSAIVAIVDASGTGGVGDWRPSSPKSRSGTFGTYRVTQDEGR